MKILFSGAIRKTFKNAVCHLLKFKKTHKKTDINAVFKISCKMLMKVDDLVFYVSFNIMSYRDERRATMKGSVQ